MKTFSLFSFFVIICIFNWNSLVRARTGKIDSDYNLIFNTDKELYVFAKHGFTLSTCQYNKFSNDFICDINDEEYKDKYYLKFTMDEFSDPDNVFHRGVTCSDYILSHKLDHEDNDFLPVENTTAIADYGYGDIRLDYEGRKPDFHYTYQHYYPNSWISKFTFHCKYGSREGDITLQYKYFEALNYTASIDSDSNLIFNTDDELHIKAVHGFTLSTCKYNKISNEILCGIASEKYKDKFNLKFTIENILDPDNVYQKGAKCSKYTLSHKLDKEEEGIKPVEVEDTKIIALYTYGDIRLDYKGRKPDSHYAYQHKYPNSWISTFTFHCNYGSREGDITLQYKYFEAINKE